MNGAQVYEPKKISPEEIEVGKNELREKAKALVKKIETDYWDLGQYLYDVYDGLPGGYRDLLKGEGSRAVRKAMFEEWGYASFGEYCEKELGIKKRSGESLRYAYYWFEIHLNLPKELKEDIKTLGRSKVYMLSGFVSSDDVMGWISKAKSMTYEDLKKSVKEAKSVKAGNTGVIDVEEADQNIGKPAPAPEVMHTVQTSLYEPQFQIWNAAFERAKGISKSEKVGHNLELICQDFLMNNDFGKSSDDDKKAWLEKIERSIGWKLIAIDPVSGKPQHGVDLLWMLVKARSEANDETDVPEKAEN
jgi:hypothetical protein